MGSSRRFLLPLCAAALLFSDHLAKAAPPVKPPATKPHAPSTTAAATKGAPASGAASTRTTKGQDTNVRRQVAGGPTLDDTSVGADTPELRALHAAERELFPPASPALGSP